jgi:hypothetical protein
MMRHTHLKFQSMFNGLNVPVCQLKELSMIFIPAIGSQCTGLHVEFMPCTYAHKYMYIYVYYYLLYVVVLSSSEWLTSNACSGRPVTTLYNAYALLEFYSRQDVYARLHRVFAVLFVDRGLARKLIPGPNSPSMCVRLRDLNGCQTHK